MSIPDETLMAFVDGELGAASLVVGLGVGFLLWRDGGGTFVQRPDGSLLASRSLSRALSSQLTADASASSAVQMGLSYRAKSGDYCRTFQLQGAASRTGLACHRGSDWQIQMLTPSVATGSDTQNLRTAASPLPPEILHHIESEIDGDPLDHAAEGRARDQGWREASR